MLLGAQPTFLCGEYQLALKYLIDQKRPKFRIDESGLAVWPGFNRHSPKGNFDAVGTARYRFERFHCQEHCEMTDDLLCDKKPRCKPEACRKLAGGEARLCEREPPEPRKERVDLSSARPERTREARAAPSDDDGRKTELEAASLFAALTVSMPRAPFGASLGLPNIHPLTPALSPWERETVALPRRERTTFAEPSERLSCSLLERKKVALPRQAKEKGHSRPVGRSLFSPTQPSGSSSCSLSHGERAGVRGKPVVRSNTRDNHTWPINPLAEQALIPSHHIAYRNSALASSAWIMVDQR